MNKQFVEMHPESSHSKRRQATMVKRFFCLLPVTLVSAPLVAQNPRDTVVAARAVSSTWQDVDRLKQELLIQRSLELSLFRKLAEVEMQKQAALPDSQRMFLQAHSQVLFSQMREASMEQGKLMRRIETLCASVRKPKGWIGVNTTGVQLNEQRGGTTYIRFLEPPVVASVDPGSPADRVGVRSGDVLVEIGGQRLLQTSVSFADLLQPGREIAIKLQRDGETVILQAKVEPLPDVSTAPCAWVDPATAYAVRPTAAQAPRVIRFESSPGKYSYGFATTRRDTSGVLRAATGGSGGTVMAGPMVTQFTGGTNSLAGLQLVMLSPESSRAFGVEHGILVNQVAPGTPGRKAGLQGGDILLLADSVEVRSIQHLQRVLFNASDRVVTLVVVRDKKRETLQLRW